MRLCCASSFFISFGLLLIGSSPIHSQVPLPINRPSYANVGGYEGGYAPPIMHPGEEVSYFENMPPSKNPALALYQPIAQAQPQTPPELWYPQGMQIVPEPNQGFFGTIYRYIISFIKSLVPSPIRYIMGWY